LPRSHPIVDWVHTARIIWGLTRATRLHGWLMRQRLARG